MYRVKTVYLNISNEYTVFDIDFILFISSKCQSYHGVTVVEENEMNHVKPKASRTVKFAYENSNIYYCWCI